MKAQVIRHKCCGKIYAACRVPECYSEASWHKDMRTAIKKGDIVDTLDSFEFGRCTCKEDNEPQKSLFQ